MPKCTDGTKDLGRLGRRVIAANAAGSLFLVRFRRIEGRSQFSDLAASHGLERVEL